jgi:hypothetical protein
VNDTPKIESVAPRKLVRFVDLKARGIMRLACSKSPLCANNGHC